MEWACKSNIQQCSLKNLKKKKFLSLRPGYSRWPLRNPRSPRERIIYIELLFPRTASGREPKLHVSHSFLFRLFFFPPFPSEYCGVPAPPPGTSRRGHQMYTTQFGIYRSYNIPDELSGIICWHRAYRLTFREWIRHGICTRCPSCLFDGAWRRIFISPSLTPL